MSTDMHTARTDPEVAAEAAGAADAKRLTIGGAEYLLPPTSSEWSLETLEAFEDGKTVAALRGLLGADQWQRLKAAGATLNDLNELAEEIARAYGFDTPGE